MATKDQKTIGQRFYPQDAVRLKNQRTIGSHPHWACAAFAILLEADSRGTIHRVVYDGKVYQYLVSFQIYALASVLVWLTEDEITAR